MVQETPIATEVTTPVEGAGDEQIHITATTDDAFNYELVLNSMSAGASANTDGLTPGEGFNLEVTPLEWHAEVTNETVDYAMPNGQMQFFLTNIWPAENLMCEIFGIRDPLAIQETSTACFYSFVYVPNPEVQSGDTSILSSDDTMFGKPTTVRVEGDFTQAAKYVDAFSNPMTRGMGMLERPDEILGGIGCQMEEVNGGEDPRYLILTTASGFSCEDIGGQPI